MCLYSLTTRVSEVCHPRIVIHLRRIGDADLVFFSSMVGKRLPRSQGFILFSKLN
mgnify:CR=1 FL=1